MLKALDIWLPAWLAQKEPVLQKHEISTRHILLCVCDHWEPFHKADKPTALDRVAEWRRDWKKATDDIRDQSGTPVRHTFFYPIEKWDDDVCGRMADLCHETGGEAEIHLHHDNDTAENLRATLAQGLERYRALGMATREGDAPRYGFIHGNWALDHSHPHGRFCGVSNELAILRQTGCYADFTLPSAPNRTQTRTINSIYYAKEDGQPRSHEYGRPMASERDRAVRPADADELLLVQGPLALNWQRRKLGLLPRIENGDLTGKNPPTIERLRLWMKCRVTVEGRPNWLAVKLHTHGAPDANRRMLLGDAYRKFHRDLAELAKNDTSIRYHYVTARELVNILHAAEAGHTGDPGQFRNFRYQRGW